MKKTEFQLSLCMSVKQTNNQLFFFPTTLQLWQVPQSFVYISLKDSCAFTGIYLASTCFMCQMDIIICVLRHLSAVIGNQSQIHFKSSFDPINLQGCQLLRLMGSERGTAETTSTLFGVQLMLLTECCLCAECGFRESCVKYFSWCPRRHLLREKNRERLLMWLTAKRWMKIDQTKPK